MAAIGLGIGAGAAAIGLITGRTHYLLTEVELPARAARKFDLRSLTDAEALASLVEEEEVIVAGFRELVDELLPALRAEAAAERDCPTDARHSEKGED